MLAPGEAPQDLAPGLMARASAAPEAGLTAPPPPAEVPSPKPTFVRRRDCDRRLYSKEPGPTRTSTEERDDTDEQPLGQTVISIPALGRDFLVDIWRQDQFEHLKRVVVHCVFKYATGKWHDPANFHIKVHREDDDHEGEKGNNKEDVIRDGKAPARITVTFKDGIEP